MQIDRARLAAELSQTLEYLKEQEQEMLCRVMAVEPSKAERETSHE